MTPRNDYSDWSKEDLIKKIKTLEKRKKYGLVWDSAREPEQVVLDCQNELPVLKEIKDKEVQSGEDDVTHILIEGDNYHALCVLNYTHEKAVDLIYIDPPFNTGSKSWKYNNNYIEKDDPYRHSRWLSFMSSRLKLARNLLADDGIIIVAIDDYEYHTLRALMDELYNENRRLGTIVVVHNPRGRNDDKFFATMHEYMLVYGRNTDHTTIQRFDYKEEELDEFNKADEISAYTETTFMRTGNNSDRDTRPNLYYPIYYSPDVGEMSLSEHKGWVELLPINPKGEEKTWRWGKETFSQNWKTELTVRQSKGIYRIFKKRRIINIRGKKPRTVWSGSRYDASSNGIMVLNAILGNKHGFPYPKSIYTERDIIKLCSKPDSIVLDFFAGSGTTGHAVLDLNQEDGGRRQFILCTNNENNICTEVCYPRIQRVMNGYKNAKGEVVEGLGGNLKYYQTAFVPASPTDKNKELLTKQSIEMLTLKEGTFEEVTENPSYCIYRNSERYTGIIFDQCSFADFKKAVSKVKKPISLYIFSLADEDFSDDFADMKGLVKISAIPESILRVYRRIFR
ncbi:site-specific DNA-methyltransferase [Chloroflexota bacterium]